MKRVLAKGQQNYVNKNKSCIACITSLNIPKLLSSVLELYFAIYTELYATQIQNLISD